MTCVRDTLMWRQSVAAQVSQWLPFPGVGRSVFPSAWCPAPEGFFLNMRFHSEMRIFRRA